MCGLLEGTRQLMGLLRGTTVWVLHRLVRPLAVCGHIGGGAAVAVGGLGPLDIKVEELHLQREENRDK